MAATPLVNRMVVAIVAAAGASLGGGALVFAGETEAGGVLALGGGLCALGLLVWLRVGPLFRLLRLRKTMNLFASGGTGNIPTSGQDELGDMGRAFEYLVTALHNREARLADQLSFQRTLLDTLPNPVYFTDLKGNFLGCNLAFERVIGRPRESVEGEAFQALVPDETARIHQRALDRLTAEKNLLVFETSLMFADGEERHVLYLKDLFRHGDGEIAGSVGAWVDITDRKAMEEELRRMATTDALTGATNRGHFYTSGEEELLRAHRYGHPMTVLMLDADKFKSVNDTHGHTVGDTVLCRLSDVCQGHVRATDIFGRLGGEEFAFVLPETDTAGGVEFAERVRKDLEAQRIPLETGGDLSFTVSIGVSQFKPDEDDTLEDILKRADEALYKAKDGGRNRVKTG